MFQIGDIVIYSQQGVCKIHDITEKTLHGTTMRYFMMHPIDDNKTTFYAPVGNDKIHMRPIMSEEEAHEILHIFDDFDSAWVDDKKKRDGIAKETIRKDDPVELTKMVKTLMERQSDTKEQKKSFSKTDSDWLDLAQKLLFTEIACVLGLEREQIEARCLKNLKPNTAS